MARRKKNKKGKFFEMVREWTMKD